MRTLAGRGIVETAAVDEKNAETARSWRLPPGRSYLYVPATKLELFEKALASAADAVILDLEDGVAVERKAEGRRNLVELLTSACAKPLYVRINPLQTEFASEDLDAAAGLPITGIRIAKARCASEVAEACARLRRLGFPGGVQLLIETAEGIINLRELARADALVEILSLGEGDIGSELACEKQFLWPARWEAVLASRAAGLQRPIQGGHPGLEASESLERTTREGRRAGFFGRIALHPAQLATINRVYTRCIHEVEYARDSLARLVEAIRGGQRTTRDMHGHYLSEWYRPSAERILQEFDRFGALESCSECRSGVVR
jgi:citrate lyase subunit beta/citryl-CoA lyase